MSSLWLWKRHSLRGGTVEYTYDGAGVLAHVQHSAVAAPDLDFGFDRLGRQT
jgi:hypothetical protein